MFVVKDQMHEAKHVQVRQGQTEQGKTRQRGGGEGGEGGGGGKGVPGSRLTLGRTPSSSANPGSSWQLILSGRGIDAKPAEGKLCMQAIQCVMYRATGAGS